MKKYFFTRVTITIVSFVFIICSCKKKEPIAPVETPTTTTITDIDGNVYNTVTIGTQIWMVENLKTSHFRDGSPIPEVEDSLTWENSNTGSAWCYYNKDAPNDSVYGKLYNFSVVTDSRNVCPKGWHIPSDSEWSILYNYSNGNNNYIRHFNFAANALRETGIAHWVGDNTTATNSSGFTALPGGFRDAYGFQSINFEGIWWASKLFDPNDAWDFSVYAYYVSKYPNPIGIYSYGAGVNSNAVTNGFSIRCVKD